MEITWFGTAGFRLRQGSVSILVDPYLTRNPRARPVQGKRPADVADANQIFLSHAHFDHLLDVPAIARVSGARIYGSPVVGAVLLRCGTPRDRIETVGEGGRRYAFPGYAAETCRGRHVRFDAFLVARTLLRSHLRMFHLLNLFRDYPAGPVLSWRFDIGGLSVCHIGSAGATEEDLARLAACPTDVLLLPLQGHSRITRIALDHVAALRPRMVIPHHMDDFYPPLSAPVDPGPFVAAVRRDFPDIPVRVPVLNEAMNL